MLENSPRSPTPFHWSRYQVRILKIIPEVGSEIRCDGYVPVVARTLGFADFPLIHWRTGDARSLVDFGIDPATGVICRITVTMLGDVETSPVQNDDISELSNGVPCVFVEDWNPKTPLHVEQPVNAVLFGNRLVLQFGRQIGQLSTAIRNGRVVFRFDQSHIISGVEILELSEKELEEFRYTVGITA